jgi:hypothetical protein
VETPRAEASALMPAEKRIYVLAAICGLLTALAFVVPRFVPSSEGGFASAGTAILVFLGVLLVTTFVALHLLAVTIRAYREISLPARLSGIAPSVVLVAALAYLLTVLRY